MAFCIGLKSALARSGPPKAAKLHFQSSLTAPRLRSMAQSQPLGIMVSESRNMSHSPFACAAPKLRAGPGPEFSLRR